MTDYVKSTNFTSKDSLASGNPLKIVKGTEFDIEFNNIATAVATKADLNSPALIGTPTAPTASSSTNTTQVATTAFVTAADTVAVAAAATAAAAAYPTKTGTGASGTWVIAITGNAATATGPAGGGSFVTSSNIGSQSVSYATTAGTANNVLGVSQTWQTPSRTYDTSYRNTTGKAIQVCASTRGSGSAYWQISTDDATWYNTTYAAGGGGYHGTTLIVPNNHYYRINGAATIDVWTELR